MKLVRKQTKFNQIGAAHWVVPLTVIVLVAVVGVRVLTTSHAATPVDNDPPSGLVIQVSTLSPSVTPATLKAWLDSIRQSHRNSGKPGYITSVVLQDIADQNGNLLTNYLNVIAPYLPGGATPAFSQAYIGTVDLPWTGTGSKYIDGIESAAFRSQNVNLSATAAQAFKKNYPKVKADWYITYEANLAGFWDSSIESSYATYINQLVPALSAVTPGKTFLWSPSFWTTYSNEPSWALPSLQANFGDFFSKVEPHLAIDIQDFVGQSNGATTKADAVTWMKYLKQNWPTANNSIEANAEQFKENSTGGITVGDSVEVPARETYYVQQGFPVGPSWEIRYWHQRLYGS